MMRMMHGDEDVCVLRKMDLMCVSVCLLTERQTVPLIVYIDVKIDKNVMY